MESTIRRVQRALLIEIIQLDNEISLQQQSASSLGTQGRLNASGQQFYNTNNLIHLMKGENTREDVYFGYLLLL